VQSAVIDEMEPGLRIWLATHERPPLPGRNPNYRPHPYELHFDDQPRRSA
jgi:hypothetical protein